MEGGDESCKDEDDRRQIIHLGGRPKGRLNLIREHERRDNGQSFVHATLREQKTRGKDLVGRIVEVSGRLPVRRVQTQRLGISWDILAKEMESLPEVEEREVTTDGSTRLIALNVEKVAIQNKKTEEIEEVAESTGLPADRSARDHGATPNKVRNDKEKDDEGFEPVNSSKSRRSGRALKKKDEIGKGDLNRFAVLTDETLVEKIVEYGKEDPVILPTKFEHRTVDLEGACKGRVQFSRKEWGAARTKS
ncbi:hypothetical protein R1sor_004878 [Riccia sorocarpa]|uniref:Uncharacterized protein n=1 Tax=Riccia sorocarpa TaxID=122646 RepID=A0ABD3HLG2_9MARC